MTNLNKLRGLMVERNLSVNELAERLGISRQATSAKINGKLSINITDADTISRALCMTPAERDAVFFADAVKSEATK